MSLTDPIREKVLLAALPEAGVHGFTDRVLNAAAENAGLAPDEAAAVFPNGPVDLIEAFSDWADAKMIDVMAKSPPDVKLRERVARAVIARIEALAPYKPAARRATAFLALPQHAAATAKLTMKTVDAMWHAAGDAATDFSYYTKRATLAGVYGATFLYWLSDSSEGHTATWTFLDKRIADVMEFEKFKGEAAKAASNIPDPFKILGSIRAALRPRW